MNKIFLSSLGLFIAASLFSQNRSTQVLWSGSTELVSWYISEKAPNDTLFPPIRPNCSDSLFIYIFTGGSNGTGYVSGTNSWGDLEKGQAFTATMDAKVSDVIAALPVVAGNGNYTAKVYAVSNDTVIGSVLGQSAPANIQTPNLYIIPITTPPSVANGTKFMVSLTVKSGSGDTIAIYTSKFGCGNRESFEKWDNNNWYVIETVYGQDLDFLMGAVLVDNASLMSGETFTSLAYPMPATDMVTLSAGMRTGGVYNFLLFNATGALVQSRNLGYVNAGSFAMNLDLTQLPSGVYSYRLFSGEAQSFGKIIKK